MSLLLQAIIQIGLSVGQQFAKKSGPHVEEAKQKVAGILGRLADTVADYEKGTIVLEAAEAIAMAQFDELEILFNTFLEEELIDAEAVPNLIIGGFKNSFFGVLGKFIP